MLNALSLVILNGCKALASIVLFAIILLALLIVAVVWLWTKCRSRKMAPGDIVIPTGAIMWAACILDDWWNEEED